MKLFIVSDTHSKLQKVKDVYSKLRNIDMLIHLGDCEQDAYALEQDLGIDTISVKGNMDGSHSKEDYKILDTEYGKLLLTHGHMQQVKATVQNLRYLAEEQGCKAALFGHTHKPYFEEINGLYLINPGSLPLPTDGTQGSYAIVNTSKDELTASIVYYSELLHSMPEGAQKKKTATSKVEGGYLKNLLNNSDRF